MTIDFENNDVTDWFLLDLKNLLLFDLIDLTSELDIVIYSDFLYLTSIIFLLLHQWINVFTIDSIITINQSLLSHHWLRSSINQISFRSNQLLLIYLQKSFCSFSIRVTSIDFVNLFISFLIVWVFHLDSFTTCCICLSVC